MRQRDHFHQAEYFQEVERTGGPNKSEGSEKNEKLKSRGGLHWHLRVAGAKNTYKIKIQIKLSYR